MNTEMNPPKLLTVSGKKGAGKDTLAPLITQELNAIDPIQLSCADPLKDIVDDFIVTIRASEDRATAADNLLKVDPELPAEFRDLLVDTLFTAVHENPDEHSRSHSLPAVRTLQLYGTDFRRKQDPDFWVKLAVQRAEQEISEGRFPYFTDARFPNEVSGLAAIGGVSVRLDVSPEEQARRLQARDGRVPDPAELAHVSETALDDYPDFDVRVQGLGVGPTLNLIMAHMVG